MSEDVSQEAGEVSGPRDMMRRGMKGTKITYIWTIRGSEKPSIVCLELLRQ